MFVLLEVLIFGEVQFGYLLSLALSYVVGIAVGFTLYRRFVFVDSDPWPRSLLRFVSVYISSIAINAALLPALVSFGDLPPIMAQAFALVLTVAVSYAGHRWFSFKGGVRGRDEEVPE